MVPVEDTEPSHEGIAFLEPAELGQHIRWAGEDLAVGSVVLSANRLIRPAEIGMAAAVGRAAVLAYPHPRVAVLSTGDELVEPGQPLQTGQIYNSNAYALAAQVIEAGGIVAQRLHARDSAQALRDAFDACAGADVIITSGGVSVGDYDFVKAVFAERGTLDFWQTAIRPGKPIAFGQWGSTLFFGLPGNPVSSMVTFELFVRPALRKMRGLTELTRPLVFSAIDGGSHPHARPPELPAGHRVKAGRQLSRDPDQSARFWADALDGRSQCPADRSHRGSCSRAWRNSLRTSTRLSLIPRETKKNRHNQKRKVFSELWHRW